MPRRWAAHFYIKPVCTTIVKPSGEIALGEFKLAFDDSRGAFSGDASVELDITDCSEAKRILIDRIERELLPGLMLATGCGMEFDPDDIILSYEGADARGVIITSVIKTSYKIQVGIASEAFTGELERYLYRIKGLNKLEQEWLLRALRFWNKGAVERDPIDKFIHFYVALEILAKRVLGFSDLNDRVINEIKKRCDVNLKYEIEGKEWDIHRIRTHLLHGGATNSKDFKELDRAIEVANKISDKLGNGVLNLVKIFLSGKCLSGEEQSPV